MSVNTETRWWVPLDEAGARFRRSPYCNCYLNLHEAKPGLLFELAGWFRQVADLVETGGRLKEASDADA